MQNILFLQSLWAMERRQTDGVERSLEDNIAMILEAGYDGVSMSFTDIDSARRAGALLKPHGKAIEAQWYPETVDDLKPALKLCTEIAVHHLDVQPDVRPRRLQDCIPLVEGWRRLSEEVDFPVYIETHRDRMTTDLYYGFRSWRRRAGPNEALAFACEPGPQPCAITGRDGNDTTDRWQEALILRDAVRQVWERVASEDVAR